MKKIAILLMLSLIFITGCSGNTSTSDTENRKPQESEVTDYNTSSDSKETSSDKSKLSDNDMFSDRDFESDYDKSECVFINLNGNSAESSSDSVRISNGIISITEEATYYVTGTLDDGMLDINADGADKIQIIFDGVSISHEDSAALYIVEADKVFLTLAPGSENVLSNGGTFEAIDDNNIDGAIFSKQDLTINGSGSLTVDSSGGHGIVCKDDLVITDGTITINSSSHGIDANDSVRIADGVLNIDSGKDGIHSENSDDSSLGFVYIENGSFDIEAEGDGISSAAFMKIHNGTFNLVTGGGSVNSSKQSSDYYGGYMGGGPGGPGGRGGHGGQQYYATDSTEDSTSIKAIKSSGDMTINGGAFTIDSADDSIHSNSSVYVNNGTFTIGSGDDAFHADETLIVSNGTITISESYEGLEALNIEVNGGCINLTASDDGLNAAGGTDSSGYGGNRGGDKFGGGPAGPGAPGGSSSSNGSILIAGGEMYINASGDGIDANGSISITGGFTTVCGPTQGDTATLDYDTTAEISGGTFIGTGAFGMAQTFSSSKQGLISLSVGNQSAGTKVVIADSDGNIIVSYEPELSYGVVIISTPEMVSGESYTVSIGDYSEVFEAN